MSPPSFSVAKSHKFIGNDAILASSGASLTVIGDAPAFMQFSDYTRENALKLAALPTFLPPGEHLMTAASGGRQNSLSLPPSPQGQVLDRERKTWRRQYIFTREMGKGGSRKNPLS